MQISSGLANCCVRNRGNPVRQGDSDRKAGRRVARTFATKMAIRGVEAALARLSGQPLGKRWRVRRSVSCDKELGTSWDVPFVGSGGQCRGSGLVRRASVGERGEQVSLGPYIIFSFVL